MGTAGTKGVARVDRERQIVDVAGALFSKQGFAATSLAAVAEQAGISKPLIYNYFGSKEGLYSACLTEAGEVIAGVIDETANRGAVGVQRALITLEQIFTTLRPRPWMWRLLHDPTPPAVAEIAAQRDTYLRRMRAVAEEGVGELLRLTGNADPLDTSAMTAVWINVFDALVTWSIDHPEQSPQEMTERTVRLFTSVFGPIDVDRLLER